MFERDYTAARLNAEEVVTFTQAESRVIEYLARHPGQVLSRSQILDAVSDPGSDRTDRSVDFLINRIRRKLGDDPKDPRFIATRYGGGYVWVAPAAPPPEPEVEDSYVVIGGFRGTDLLGAEAGIATGLAEGLKRALAADLGPGREVRILPASGAPARDGPLPPVRIDLVFFQDRTGTECVVSCRSGVSRRVFLAERLQLGASGAPLRLPGAAALRDLARRILNDQWRNDVDHLVADTPLPVAMMDAAVEREDSRAFVRSMAPKLRDYRERYPDDPHIKLIYATHIHSEYVILGPELAQTARDRRAADAAEIERLVLDAIDYAQTRPHLALMAAKLLHFVDAGYKTLALELAEDAHAAGTSVSSSLAILGQLQTFVGDVETGIHYLKQALDLAEPDSNFERYVLVLLCQALIATDRRDELDPYRTRLYGVHPLLRLFLEPMFTDPERPSMRAKGAMLVMPRARANALLSHLHYAWARLYEAPEHRANALRAPVTLAVRRFGRDVVPPEIAEGVPGLRL